MLYREKLRPLWMMLTIGNVYLKYVTGLPLDDWQVNPASISFRQHELARRLIGRLTYRSQSDLAQLCVERTMTRPTPRKRPCLQALING